VDALEENIVSVFWATLGESMPTIHFEPDGKKIAATGSETILGAALRAGIPTAHSCGGDARCSICRVSIEKGLEHCAPMSVAR
jgi:ferredoxin